MVENNYHYVSLQIIVSLMADYLKINKVNSRFLHNGALSVTDYLLLHINNINSLNNFHVEEFNNFSDHAAVYFSIAGNTQINININNTGNVTDKESILFIARKSQITSPYYHETITNYKILTWTYPAQLKYLHHSYEKMQTNFSQRNTKINIRNQAKKTRPRKPGQTTRPRTPKWFNHECYAAK